MKLLGCRIAPDDINKLDVTTVSSNDRVLGENTVRGSLATPPTYVYSSNVGNDTPHSATSAWEKAAFSHAGIIVACSRGGNTRTNKLVASHDMAAAP